MAEAVTRWAYLETNLGTRVAIFFHYGEPIPDFKERLCMKHQQIFPQFGEISICGFKIKRDGRFYLVPDDNFLDFAKASEHIHKDWFLHVDVLSDKMKKERKQKQRHKQNKLFKNQNSSLPDTVFFVIMFSRTFL
ncbi:hypothetical protein EUTSA_v10027990mg [Eutrema salsugineum]|uniref:Uncharacterized protein n=1 Tax=Eutrema salsugineum TaxID=72664 RepID=V4LU75_EUTSA|nr:hypothetical protein EUTSA_v10027990mg [Eutrema salsugineum]